MTPTMYCNTENKGTLTYYSLFVYILFDVIEKAYGAPPAHYDYNLPGTHLSKLGPSPSAYNTKPTHSQDLVYNVFINFNTISLSALIKNVLLINTGQYGSPRHAWGACIMHSRPVLIN